MSVPDVDVAEFLDRLRDIAAEWDSAHHDLETMLVTAHSDDGLVTVTCDAGGSVVDLGIDRDPTAESPSDLADTVLDTVAAAVREANERRAGLVRRSLRAALRSHADGSSP